MANVDLKSLFTSEKQYTVLQLLNVLIDEVGKSMVKTATINQDVDAGTLTLTITLSDDSVVTASTDLKSLTDTEKSLISTLTSNVNATNEGVTFLKVVGFEGNETHKGSEIHQGYESHLGDESHSGTATYKGVIKTSEIDNTAGNAMLRNKDTEGAIVLGSVSKKAVIMGSGDRPTYSKDGSDFAGKELALKSDVADATLGSAGIAKFANVQFVTLGSSTFITQHRLDYYTNLQYAFENISCWTADAATLITAPLFDLEALTTTPYLDLSHAFIRITQNSNMTIRFNNSPVMPSMSGAFCNSTALSAIAFKDGVSIAPTSLRGAFRRCTNLVTLPAFDLSNCNVSGVFDMFNSCTSLKRIPFTHWKYSFDIHYSTAFEEADLVEILNNLDPVSTTQTLTMGATNLAKLTSDDILIATGKGWALA